MFIIRVKQVLKLLGEGESEFLNSENTRSQASFMKNQTAAKLCAPETFIVPKKNFLRQLVKEILFLKMENKL